MTVFKFKRMWSFGCRLHMPVLGCLCHLRDHLHVIKSLVVLWYQSEIISAELIKEIMLSPSSHFIPQTSWKCWGSVCIVCGWPVSIPFQSTVRNHPVVSHIIKTAAPITMLHTIKKMIVVMENKAPYIPDFGSRYRWVVTFTFLLIFCRHLRNWVGSWFLGFSVCCVKTNWQVLILQTQ
jgi:hypothetical protein